MALSPATISGYLGLWPTGFMGTGAVRSHRIDELSGTVPGDLSSSRVDGTYSARSTLGAPGVLASDGDTAVSSGEITAPATGLTSGGAARTVEL